MVDTVNENSFQQVIVFCRRNYKVKFDIDPDYIFQTASIISLS